jgi:hypothetical protein
LELRVKRGADDGDEGAAAGAQIAPINADELLIKSLARLRGQIKRRNANMPNVN